MLHTNLTHALPAKYQMINEIVSISLRHELSYTIGEIQMVLKETRDFEPDPGLILVVNRFFEYLVGSCKTRSKMIRRSEWLLTISKIVLHKLYAFRNRYIRQHIDDYEHIFHNDLANMVVAMSQKLAEYQTHRPLKNADQVLELIHAIIETTSNMKSGQPAHYYNTLEVYGSRIVQMISFHLNVNQLTLGKPRLTCLDEDRLYRELFGFYYRLRSYRQLTAEG